MKRRYYPSPGELEVMVKEEALKRRQFRLNQVREQSKTLAADIRENVRREKAYQTELWKRKINDEKEQEKENHVQQLQAMEQYCLQEVGASHRLAMQQPEKDLLKKREQEQLALRTLERSKRALSALQSTNAGEHETPPASPGKKQKAVKNKVTVHLPLALNEHQEDVSCQGSDDREIVRNTNKIPPDFKHQKNLNELVKVVSEKNGDNEDVSESNHDQDVTNAWTAALHQEISEDTRVVEQKAFKKKRQAAERPNVANENSAQCCLLKKTRQQGGSHARELSKEAEEAKRQRMLEKEMERIFGSFFARMKQSKHMEAASAKETTSSYQQDTNKSEVSLTSSCHPEYSMSFGRKLGHRDAEMLSLHSSKLAPPLKIIRTKDNATSPMVQWCTLPPKVDAATITDATDGPVSTGIHAGKTRALSNSSARSSETSYLALPDSLEKSMLAPIMDNLSRMGIGSPNMVESLLRSGQSRLAKGIRENQTRNAATSPIKPPYFDSERKKSQSISELFKQKMPANIRQKVFPEVQQDDKDEESYKMWLNAGETASSYSNSDGSNTSKIHVGDQGVSSEQHLRYFPQITTEEDDGNKNDALRDDEICQESTKTVNEFGSMETQLQREMIKSIVEKQLRNEDRADILNTASDFLSISALQPNFSPPVASEKPRPPVSWKSTAVNDAFIPHELSTLVEEKESMAEHQSSSDSTASMGWNFTLDASLRDSAFTDLTVHIRGERDDNDEIADSSRKPDGNEAPVSTQSSFSGNKAKEDMPSEKPQSNKDVQQTPESATSSQNIATPSVSSQSYRSVPTPSSVSSGEDEDDCVTLNTRDFWANVFHKAGVSSETLELLEKVVESDLGSVQSLQPENVVGQSTPVKSKSKSFMQTQEPGIMEEPELTLVDLDDPPSPPRSPDEDDLNKTLTDSAASFLSHWGDIQDEKGWQEVLNTEPSESLLSFLLHEMSIAASTSVQQEDDDGKD